jgi:hypothetical protein
MEPTITQNSALYLAHRKVSKRRATLFRGLRSAASKQRPDAQRQLTCTALFIARRLHQAGGEPRHLRLTEHACNPIPRNNARC